MRRNFPTHVKRAASERANGHCEMLWNGERCNRTLRSGAIYDHINPDWFSGDNSLDNCAVICPRCDKLKTFGADIPNIARAKRLHDRERGIKPVKGRELPCKRNSPFKKKIIGPVVWRSTGERV